MSKVLTNSLKKLTLPLILIATCYPGYAQDKIVLDVLWSGSSKSVVFLGKKDSIREVENGKVQFWGVVTNLPTRDFDVGLELFEFDCKAQKMRILSNNKYKNGENISSNDKPTEWTYCKPYTHGETLADYACRRGKKAYPQIKGGSLSDIRWQIKSLIKAKEASEKIIHL